MKRWKRRLTAWLLVLLLALGLGPQEGRAVLSEVYFTAVNDRVLELRDETMPFRSEGVLYVPSTLFEGGDLGVSYVRNDHMGLAMLYTTKIDLRFDLEKQTASDKQGRIYSGHAIERGGIVFFPLPLVCGYFGLDWSYNQTKTVPLVRVKSESAILDDVGFIDAASWQMAGLYADYLRSTESPPEGPSAPQTPEPPPPVQAAEGQKIYLLLSSRSGEDTRRAMELLGDAQGTFLLNLEQLEDGDLIRGLTALGHGVVLRARGETEEDLAWELRRAGELLWQAQPVFRVPAGVVGGVEHPAAPLGLELLPLLVGGDGHRLIIGEEEQVGPLFYQGRGLFLQLQFPTVIRAHLVGLLKLPHHGVGRQNHMDTTAHDLLQEIQQTAKLLRQIDIALAIPHILNAAQFLVGADTGNAQLLRPVGRVDHQRGAHARVATDVLNLLHEHCPAGGLIRAGHIHVPGRALGVDEHRTGEVGGQGGLANALRAVDNHLQSAPGFAGMDFQLVH